MSDSNPAEVRIQLGRNLTHGMLDALGRAIVTAVTIKAPFPPKPSLPSSTAPAARSPAKR